MHQEHQYLNLLKEVLEKGTENIDRGTGAKSWSVFGRQTRYDLSKDFPLLTTKKVYWKGVLHELYWFLSGQTNIKYLVDNNIHIWDDYPYKIYAKKDDMPQLTKEEFIANIKENGEFAKQHGELPRIYGEMWRKWPTKRGDTIDQLQWVINELKEDPFARNAIVSSWNPEYLYTMASFKDACRFPICHNMYQLSIKDGKLSLQLYQRTADLFLGVPFNIASYALLVIVLAQILEVQPGEFVHTFGDAHIYENHVDQAREQLSREPRLFPQVKIDEKIKSLADFTPDLVVLENYDSHPAVKGELTVAGGLYEKEQIDQTNL